MTQTYIDQLKGRIGEDVTLKGWLYNTRSSGKLVFLQLRDGSGIVRCVVFKGNDEAVFEKAKALGQESSIVVTGTVKEDTRRKGRGRGNYGSDGCRCWSRRRGRRRRRGSSTY